MIRMNECRKLQILIFSFVLGGTAYASPDRRLISLVPEGAQLVTGISASSFQGQPNNFILITGRNRMDLNDFYALTGSDDTRQIHQALFVALSRETTLLNEHSLLVSGHFDKQHVYESAIGSGAKVTGYRGIEIAEIPPFSRERKKVNEVRWLAILDSSLLVFGSIALAQLELDRFLAHSHADQSLLRRFDHLRSHDQTWCVLAGSISSLSSSSWRDEIRSTLATVNPDLAEQGLSAEEFEFGVFYGGKVEFEYFFHSASAAKRSTPVDPSKVAANEPIRPLALLSAVDTTAHTGTVHRVIAIPMSRYEEWLARISNRRR